MANDVSSAVHRIAKCGMRNMRSSRDYHHSVGFGFVYGDTATLPRFPHKLSNKIYNATLNDNTTRSTDGLSQDDRGESSRESIHSPTTRLSSYYTSPILPSVL